jgi:hypothetical protein
VDLEVSAGALVPDVEGLTEAQAISAITAAGLVPFATSTASTTVPVGQVFNQNPLAGTVVESGTTVTFNVSTGTVVPDVVNLSEAAAQASLTSAGLIKGTVTTTHHQSIPAGNVVSQNPLAGNNAEPGSAVDLVLSLGRVPVVLQATQIAMTGDAAPDGNGSFSSFSGTILNDAGQVAFWAELEGTSGGSADGKGFFRGSGGALTQIARRSQAAPDGNGILGTLFLGVALNNAGEVAFTADLSDTSGGVLDNRGIFRGSGGALTQIARKGQAAPDGNGSVSYLTDWQPELNDAGQAAFYASLIDTTGGTTDDSGIFRGSGGAVALIAREGQVAADNNGSFSSFSNNSGFVTRLNLNDAGVVAFSAALGGTCGPGNGGIFVGDGEEIAQVVLHGDTLAGGIVSSANMSPYSDINLFGQVVYEASFAGGGEGVFVFTPDLHWRSAASGNWDDHTNWTLGLSPGFPHDIFIDPDSGLTVAGPGADTTVIGLTIGTQTSGSSVLDVNSGNLTINEHGTIGAADTLSANSATVTLNGTVENSGTVEATNGGEVRVGTGALIDGGSVRAFIGGMITGGGTINAPVSNDTGGIMSPGSSTGCLTLGDDYTQDGFSTLLIEIDGTTPCSGHDALNVGGTANLAGELEVVLGYTPIDGDSFVILNAGAVNGTFSTLTLPALTPGIAWVVSYSATDVTVSALGDGDFDTVANVQDNCTLAANTNQRDTNGDGYGNWCDADLDNSGFVNFGDLAAFKAAFGTSDPDADLDGSGIVNFGDVARFKALFGQPPGPSCCPML